MAKVILNEANKMNNNIAERNARILLSTCFENISGSKEKGFAGDIQSTDKIKLNGASIDTNIEVKYMSSLGPSLELNKQMNGKDGKGNNSAINVFYNKDGKITGVKLDKKLTLNENDNLLNSDTIERITNYLDNELQGNSELADKIIEFNDKLKMNQSADLTLDNMSDESKQAILRNLYDRAGFNEKIFCCVNNNHFMLIPRDGKDGINKYYNLIPKLVIRKGDNNVSISDLDDDKINLIKIWVKNSIESGDEFKESEKTSGISIDAVLEGGDGKLANGYPSKTRHLYIHTTEPINNFRDIEFNSPDGLEKLGLTFPKSTAKVEKDEDGKKLFYRYKVIKKVGTYRFKFMMNIVLKDSEKEKFKELNQNIIDKSIALSPKSEYKDKWEHIDLLNFKNKEELISQLNNIPAVNQKELEESMKVKEENLNSSLKKLNEDYNKDDNKYEQFINDIYDLRQNSLDNEGEYGIGNLIFKKFRDLGYLDNLKELSRSLKVTELSEDKKEE